MNKPSMLIISGVQGAPRRYRTFHLYEQTRLAGLDSQLAHITDREVQQKAKGASIVVLHRVLFTPLIAEIGSEVHQRGGVLILDIDDLVFEPEMFRYIDSIDFADPLRASLYQEEMGMYRQTVDVCDTVTSPTEFLAQRIHRLGKPVQVHRNAFSLEMLVISEKAYKIRRGMDERFIIGYASGTATHNQDFAVIKPALINIMQKFAHTELWLVGPIDPGKAWGSMGDRIHRIKMLPWRDLPAIQSQFDINLAPVRTDNAFSQSKSEIKYIESALVRVPTIASPSEAFKHAIRPGFNGFLADNTKDWEGILEHLIFEPRSRHEVGEIAFQDVVERYHPLVRAQEFLGMLKSIVGYRYDLQYNISAQDSIQPYWSSADQERSPSLFRRGIYTMRYRSLSTLLKQIRIYLRRKISPIFPYRTHY